MSMAKLILLAADIPNGATVTKRTGRVKYTIKTDIVIYGPTSTSHTGKQTIQGLNGARFLINERGDINAVDGDTELVWLAEGYKIVEFLDPPEDK